jgi:hypothetical protein
MLRPKRDQIEQQVIWGQSPPVHFPRIYTLFVERGTRLELATACLEGVPLFALWHCGGFRRPHATFSFYSLSENCPVMVSPKTR